MERKESVYCYALSRIFMRQPRIARAIVNQFCDAETIFTLPDAVLREILGPYNKNTELILNAALDRYEKELDSMLVRGYRYIIHCDEAFPALLSECDDAPIGLFVQAASADKEIFGREKISVVGTRDMTSYGREWCGRIVGCLGNSDTRPTIVSGLAYGVDICAHSAAMEAGLPTIAVLGTGITDIYPQAHMRQAERIASSPGCAIISEYPSGASVTALNFLSRNRIIAGMSRATLLMESRLNGGGMTTARMAASYGRDVYALPGRNEDIFSQGCNYLIHSHIAEPIIGCDEFFRSINYKYATPLSNHREESLTEYYSGSMTDEKIALCLELAGHIRKQRGISVTELAGACGVDYHKVMTLLQRMESDGFINIDMLQHCSIENTGKLR